MKQVISTNNQNIVSIEEAVDYLSIDAVIICVNSSLDVKFLMKDSAGIYSWMLPCTHITHLTDVCSRYRTIKEAIEGVLKLGSNVYTFSDIKDFITNLKNIDKNNRIKED